MKFIFFLFLFSSIASGTDFVNLEQGDQAPFPGKLLTNEALAEIFSQHELELNQCLIDAEYNSREVIANHELEYRMLEIRYEAEVSMYQEMIAIRDEELRIDRRKDIIQKWGIYGSFALGVASTIGITYAVGQSFN